MKKFLHPSKKWLLPGAIAAILSGLILIWMGLTQSVEVIIDDEVQVVRTPALTVSGVLQAGGISLEDSDRVVPLESAYFWNLNAILVNQARDVMVKTPLEEHSLRTVEDIPANLMQALGITLFPEDRVLLNGKDIDPNLPLQTDHAIMLQYQPAIPVKLSIDGQEMIVYTSQATLGAALESAGIQLSPQDFISEDLSTSIMDPMAVQIRYARPVTVKTPEGSITGLSAATTVGEALQDVGVSLQNLDESIPADDAPVPDNAEIIVVRGSEDLLIATEEIPYESDYQQDPETPLDQISVIEPGQNAIFASRERVLYADGEEVSRHVQDTWQASESKTGIMGYGTKVQIRTEVVDGQTIEYWRKISVWATSYKPCDAQGVCHDGTAGGYRLEQGIIAVSPYWYSVPNGLGMADLSVYVPGYGRAIIGDTCGGCSGQYWIDLAYRDENYVPWHQWTTMYFLTPVPPYFPTIITP